MRSGSRFAVLTSTVTFLASLALVPASPAAYAQPPIAEYVDSAYIDTHRPLTIFGHVEKPLPNTRSAIARALRFVGNADKPCANDTCRNWCLHLAAKIGGHASSGSPTARAHWQRLTTADLTRRNRQPRPGALVFWDVGSAGHVATYVGDGMVVSNWSGPQGDNVYLLPIDIFEKRWPSARYLGWTPPVFYGMPM